MIRSLRHLQIAQHKVATPTRIYFFSFKSKFDSQLPNMWDTKLEGVNPVAIYTALQIVLARWQ